MRVFLVVFLFFVGSLSLYSQDQFKLNNDKYQINFKFMDSQFEIRALYDTKSMSLVFKKKNTIPPNFMYSRLGFFCKAEHKIQKKTLIPIKIRLGTLDYVNLLEYNR